MKKHLVFVLLFIFSVKSYTQTFQGEVAIGFTGTQIMGDRLVGYNKAGLYGALAVAYKLNDISDLVFELNYSEKGSRKLPKPKKGDYSIYKIKINYFEIPILYRRAIHENISIECGLAFGVLAKSSEEDEYGLFSNFNPFEKYELGFILGGSYNIKENIGVVFRSSGSVLPIRKPSTESIYSYNRGQYNIVLIFGLRFKI